MKQHEPTEIKLHNLVQAVDAMRKAQRAYFASKGDREALIDAKRLEAAVDMQVATLLRELEDEKREIKERLGVGK